MPSGFDQRQSPRARVALPVEFWIATDPENRAYPGETVNFSDTGTAFHARQRAQKHDILIVGLALPAPYPALKLSSRVIHCQPSENFPAEWDIRVKFLDPTPQEQEALQAAVFQVLGPDHPKARERAGLEPALVEERKQPRATVAGLEVKYRELPEAELSKMLESKTQLPLQTLAEAKNFHHMMEVFSENISTGGLRLQLSRPCAEGKSLFLELRFPGLPLPLHAVAAVLWCLPSEAQDGKFSAGIRFLALSKEDALKVEFYVTKGAGS